MFDQHKIGKVMRVDFVKNIAKNRREAFIHFDEWYTTDESFKLQQDITIHLQILDLFIPQQDDSNLLVNKYISVLIIPIMKWLI